MYLLVYCLILSAKLIDIILKMVMYEAIGIFTFLANYRPFTFISSILTSSISYPLPPTPSHTHTHTHIQTHKKIRGAFTSLIFMKAECYYSFLLICSHLLKKFLMENFIFVQRIAFSQISPTRKFQKSWTTTFLV